MEKLSKAKANEKIGNFFQNIKEKTPKEIKKIKRFAMKHSIPLREKRKLFCKKCLNSYSGNEKVWIKNKMKIIECKKCSYLARWKLKFNSS